MWLRSAVGLGGELEELVDETHFACDAGFQQDVLAFTDHPHPFEAVFETHSDRVFVVPADALQDDEGKMQQCRLKVYIICSFQCKYALAVYEALCLRGNLQISEQELNGSDFRALMNIPERKLTRTPDFMRRVVDPAAEEVNALSDFWVEIRPMREGGLLRGQLKGFRLIWRCKEKDEWLACLDELMRPKIGCNPDPVWK